MAQALLAASQTATADRVEGEAAARRALRAQVCRLERELSALAVSAFPRDGIVDQPAGRPAVARILSFGELEALRDSLSNRVADARQALARCTAREEEARVLLEQMLLEPGRHRFVRIANAELGERGCGVWHVRPRMGLIGMLMGWWQVKLSSRCPLSLA